MSERRFLSLATAFIAVQVLARPNMMFTRGDDDDTPTDTVEPVEGEGRVVGGKEAIRNEYPWIAFLQIRFPTSGIKKCGGSLISSQWVITAAHCVSLLDPATKELENATSVLARFGRHDISLESEPNDQSQVSAEIIINKNFTHETFEFDVALIKLRTPVRITRQVYPVALPGFALCANSFYDENSPAVENCGIATAAGWGITEAGSTSKLLKKVDLDIRASTACARVLAMSQTFSDAKICAGGSDGQDTCSGDSGGPLMCKDVDNGQTMLIGLVSYGDPECSTNIGSPGIYTRICRAIPWVRSYVPVTPIQGCYATSLPTIENGAVPTRGSNAFGSVRNVSCNSGFELAGDRTTKCQSNGIWSLPAAECKQQATTSSSTTTTTATAAATTTTTPTTTTSIADTSPVTTTRFTTTSSLRTTTRTTTTTNSTTTTTSTPATLNLRRACRSNQFQCKNGACYSSYKFCNTAKDCSDGSDEPGGCKLSTRTWAQDPDISNDELSQLRTQLLKMSATNRSVESLLTNSRAYFPFFLDFPEQSSSDSHICQQTMNSYTALHAAVACKRLENARLLVAAGADVNIVESSNRRRPIHFAADVGSPDMMQLLIQAGADLDQPDIDGKTALHFAVQSSYSPRAVLVKMLVDTGVMVNARTSPRTRATSRNATALTLADTFRNNEETKTLIRNAGGTV